MLDDGDERYLDERASLAGMSAHLGSRVYRPLLQGTRITVELVLEKLGQGMTVAELVKAYPHLTTEDVLAALSFAADYLRNEDIEFGQIEAA